MITVTVRHFAALREARGCESETLELAEGSTCKDLFLQLFPGRLSGLPVGFARNQTYTSGDTSLEDGDEVAFLPPLGGG
ncbi:MAG: MoaD/ThiS family protein [Proteobacteria bacterium]|nr:MoaD/ThiS family protein [Pseudomonadota bacterium]